MLGGVCLVCLFGEKGYGVVRRVERRREPGEMMEESKAKDAAFVGDVEMVLARMCGGTGIRECS